MLALCQSRSQISQLTSRFLICLAGWNILLGTKAFTQISVIPFPRVNTEKDPLAERIDRSIDHPTHLVERVPRRKWKARAASIPIVFVQADPRGPLA